MKKIYIEKLYLPMTCLASLGAIISLWFLIYQRTHGAQLSALPFTWVIVVSWTLVPAAWFAFENWRLIAENVINQADVYAKRKINQDSAKAAWVAIGALILALTK